MQCPKCKHENRDGAKFCRKCGAALELICPKCNHPNEPDSVFCDECGAKLSSADTATQPQLTVPKLEDMKDRLYIPESLRQKRDTAELEIHGENRLVTTLFADISGFTPLSNQHSPENVVGIVNDCFKVIVETIFKYEGDPNRFIGDNVLAFFGAPISHENDPERAIISALEIRNKVKELSLDVSIGINTGMMYFGQIGTKEHLEISAYGPDINLAKRLQETSAPGQILVGSGTYKFTRRAFEFQQTPSLNLKGMDRPITAYEAIRLKTRPEKLRGIEGLYADMIGREKEFAEIIDAVDKWGSGQGQMISIIGEAGIGKSRLVREMKQAIDRRDEDYLWLEGRCLSIGQPVSYWPFIDMFRTLFNLDDEDSDAQVATKVRDAISELLPARTMDILPFIGHLMSIRFGDEIDKKLESYTSEQIRHQMMIRLRDVFTALAKQRSLILVFEDLHWSDDLSLDLLSLLMDELASTQVILVCVYRPEQEHRCYKLSTLAQRKCFECYTELQLQKLTKVQSSQLIQTLLAIDSLSDDVRSMILIKSEGNPFFIEEVIRSLMEKGLVYRDGERWIAKDDISDIAVPDTIHGVIMERVDRLESETKYVLQCASVIGRLFRFSLLDHLMSHEQKLDRYLDELESKDLVYEERSIPELEYTFKHALTQEATYQTILEQRRRGFHHQVADGIESLYKDKIEDFYEELAYHYKVSGDNEKSIEYHIKSGIKSCKHFANADAVRYFDEAEALINESRLPHRKEKSLLYENRGQALQYMGNWTKALEDYDEALRWCDDPHNRAEIYRKTGWLEAEEMQDKLRARDHLELGLKELPKGDKSIEMVRLMIDLLWTIMDIIDIDDVIERGLEAIKIAEEMEYRQEQAILYAYMDFWHIRFEDYSGEYEQKAISIIDYLDDNPKMAWACFILGFARHLGNRKWEKAEQGVPYYSKALEIAKNTGYVYLVGFIHVSLGDAYHSLKQDDKAIENYNIGIEMIAQTKGLFPLVMAKNLMMLYVEQGRDDMVVSTFRRLMGIFNSVDIDDESHGRVLFGRGMLKWTYGIFRLCYFDMGKGSEYPHIAIKNLSGLLKEAKSQIQKAWYHNELMILNFMLDDLASAKAHAERVISIYEGMGCPDYMLEFHFAYMIYGNPDRSTEMLAKYADKIYKEGLYSAELVVQHFVRSAYLYDRLGFGQVFREIAAQIQQDMPDILHEAGLNRLVIEPIGPMEISQPQFVDSFIHDPIDSGWEWIVLGDCSYVIGEGGLRITVPFKSREEMSARLLRPHSGDFMLETVISNGIEGQKNGAIFVTTDGGESIQLHVESNSFWFTDSLCFTDNIIIYQAYVNGKSKSICTYPFNSEKVWLRLERKGDRFSGYVSSDGKNWFSCGYLDAHIGDPANVGIGASSQIIKPKSTIFEYFRIYKPE